VESVSPNGPREEEHSVLKRSKYLKSRHSGKSGSRKKRDSAGGETIIFRKITRNEKSAALRTRNAGGLGQLEARKG